MRELRSVPPPVAAIVARQRAELSQLVQEIAALAAQDDRNALEMGDKLLQIEDEYGKDRVKLATDQAGVNWSVARQRLWVSRRIPKGSRLRSLPLTFCHLRTLAATENPESWADRVLANRWSVATLRAEIERAGDRKAVEAGDPCIQCERSLAEGKRTVAFSIDGGQRARCCSTQCALAYFQEMVAEEAVLG
jgi:hypothetical protein